MITSVSRSTPVLLVVEDSPEQRMLLGEFLTDVLPCQVWEAADGDTALAHAQAHPPDLVLTDLHIPPRGGLPFLRALRANPLFTQVPVIVLSGSRRPEDIAAIEAVGACRFIEKPYDLDDLEAAILACLTQLVPG